MSAGLANEARKLASPVPNRTMPSTQILGISAFYHDSAACLLRDGEIIAAAQEERFTRKKHYAGFPSESIRYCLREGGIFSPRRALHRVLRQATGEVRATAGDLSRVRAPRAPVL